MSLSEELELQRHSHKLGVKRILIEKFLLAILFVIAGFFANRAVENYKSGLEEERFFLESRLNGLQVLNRAYGNLTDHCYRYGASAGKVSEEEKAAHEASLEEFISASKQWSFVFSEQFNDRLGYHIWFHDAIATQSVPITRENYSFALSVFGNFEEMTRMALWEDTLGYDSNTDNGVFQFADWDLKEMGRKTGKEFFDAHYEKWISEQKSK